MNPKDEMKVFVEGLSKKLKNQNDGESELGPNNSEACRLMDALQNTIDTSSFTPEEDDEGPGVGRNYLGKYAFANIKYQGTVYRVTLRNFEDVKDEGEKLINLYPSTGRVH